MLLRALIILVVALSTSRSFGQTSIAPRCARLVDMAAAEAPAVPSGQRAVEQTAEQYSKLAADKYRQQQFEAALDALEKSYLLLPTAAVLYNMAQACREGSADKPATILYEQSAARTQDPALRSEALRRVAELRRKLEREEELRAIREQQHRLEDQQRLILQQQAELAAQHRLNEARLGQLTGDRKEAPPPRSGVPVYRRWWLWTSIGGAVAAAVALSVGLVYAFPRQPIYPNLKDVTFK